jgi:hypothetical protein
VAHSIAGAFKPNRNNNLCTPRILVECLKPYFQEWKKRAYLIEGYESVIDSDTGKQCNNIVSVIKREPIVWCPFDKEYSEYVLFFKELECNVIYSHIDYGQDFFTYVPSGDYDIIISNPPFSRKLDVFKRCNELGKPWVMLTNVMSLNYMEIGNYFADNPIQMLIPDKRVSFDGNPSSFCSGYVCKGFLERDLEFCHLPHCNSGKDFVPSRMLNQGT